MKKESVLAAAAAAFMSFACLFSGCGRQDKTASETVNIPFDRAERLSYGRLPENFLGGLEYVTLRPEGQDYLFAEADKVIYRNGQLYIMDWISRKIVSFKEDGQPGTVLHKRGRGPGEYLQISDFDIDDDGSIYILDGQRDLLLRYSPGCKFEESWELPFQASFISSREDGRFYFGLSPWDDSEYGQNKVLVTDRSLGAVSAFIGYDGLDDPDFSFPASGFVESASGTVYHQPICDDVYLIGGDGVDSVYHFDFGAKAVPDEVRQDIEGHLDELDGYETLVKWVNVYGRFIVGSIRRDGRYDDFIFDRQQERVYMQDDAYRCINIAGLSQDAIIFRIIDTGEGLPDFIPENIRRSIAGSEDVFAIAKF